MSEAFLSIPATRAAPLFIFGDHASHYIPPQYQNLGLSMPDLTRHIAWDIGTDIIIRHLCAHFGCAGQLATISRLVIDLNRDVLSEGLIPKMSDGTQILGNQNLPKQEQQERIERFHTPYHLALGAMINQSHEPLIISVHSFTPKPALGAHRSADIGLLVKHDPQTAHIFIENMQTIHPEFIIKINEPYSAYDLNYTIDRHIGSRGLRHLAIEINQHHISTDDQAHMIAECLIPPLSGLISSDI